MNTLTLAWGILAVIGTALSLIPCAGRLGWLNIPFATAGAIFGLITIVRRPEGARNAVIGTALCMVASIAGLLQLVMSGDAV